MSPAATKRRPTPAASDTNTTVDAMAHAIARRQADELAVRQQHLDAYRRAVELEAKREPIPGSVADDALSAASALGLPPGRLVVDALVLRQADQLDQRDRELKAAMSEWKVDGPAIKARYEELKAEMRQLEAMSLRPRVWANETAGIADHRRELRQRSPHLFTAAAEMTSAEWNHIRAEG